jgi:hypothetical protein
MGATMRLLDFVTRLPSVQGARCESRMTVGG